MPADSPSQTPTSHAFDAIVGADDFADADNHIVMKDVLNEIVDVTQTVSPTCKWRLRLLSETSLIFTLCYSWSYLEPRVSVVR